MDYPTQDIKEKVIELWRLFPAHETFLPTHVVMAVGHRPEEGFYLEFNCMDEQDVRMLAVILSAGQYKRDREDIDKQFEDMAKDEQYQRDALELAGIIQGGTCFICKKETVPCAGDPHQLPMRLLYRGGNGKSRMYCYGCVIEALESATIMQRIGEDSKRQLDFRNTDQK